MKDRKEFIDYYTYENSIFDMNKFFTSDDIVMNNGAVIIITPYQMILTRSNPEEGLPPGSGSHDETYDDLNSVIYDLPLSSEGTNTDFREKLEEKHYVKQHQNIFIRMINEGTDFIHMKGIWIEIPKSVTSSQTEFLSYLELEYGTFFKTLSKKMVQHGEVPLVAFKMNDEETLMCDSLYEVLEYARSVINDEKKIIDDKNIIGITLDEIKKII